MEEKELMGPEREEHQQSHGLTMSKNGLGSAAIYLSKQMRIWKCGKPVCQDILFSWHYGPQVMGHREIDSCFICTFIIFSSYNF